MSAGKGIRLFSGYPVNYDARFTNIRTWGAFLVSAERKSGKIGQVRIYSEMGNPCTIINPWGKQPVNIIRNGKRSGIQQGECFTFETSKHETIELGP
jgi:hypothetical protein